MRKKQQRGIFGSVRMGYIVVGSRRLKQWKQFCTQGLGIHLAYESSSELAFRLDSHARRLIVENDPEEDVIAVGLELEGESALQVVLDRLAKRHVDVDLVDGERAEHRGVEKFYRFVGPKGMSLELFTGAATDDSPLHMLSSGFNTGTAGMGHMALTSRHPEKMMEFWREIFDARISDRIEQPMGKVMLDITFLRVNERHHTVAIAATRGIRLDPLKGRVQHFNIEAASLDDLSGAYERLKALGYKFAHGVGQHPNDRELSFYVITPSGFELEYGWDALAVDEATWEEGKVYPRISIWGHNRPSRGSFGLDFAQLRNGLKSLMRAEYLPW